MPSFKSGPIVAILAERPGLTRIEVDLGVGPEKAYVLTKLTGDVAVGDRVVVNTTAVELGLGTGGWHVVHWNLERDAWSVSGIGHIMKARYTSLQADVGSTEEAAAVMVDAERIDGMPVVVAGLHSQMAAVVVAAKTANPGLRIAYVMTDGAALPLALSDLVYTLQQAGFIDATITCGHAFGGDYEAISVHSALVVARQVVEADLVIVAMGPGIVGTGTRLGFSGMEVGGILDAVVALGGDPIACLRISFADARERHQGVSHHTLTALRIGSRESVTLALPELDPEQNDVVRADLERAGLGDRHRIVSVAAPDVVALFDEHDLVVTSMGRSAAQDRALFAAGAAAGTLAAQRCDRSSRLDSNKKETLN